MANDSGSIILKNTNAPPLPMKHCFAPLKLLKRSFLRPVGLSCPTQKFGHRP